MRLDGKMLDFGTPLAPSWVPNGAQNHPSVAKKPPKKHKMEKDLAPFLATSSRLAPKVAFGAFLGTILVDSGWILHDF